MDLEVYLQKALASIRRWESEWGDFERHSSLRTDEKSLRETFGRYLKLLEGNYPFFHPHYAGQMLKPPHPVAVAGYLAAMLINPNNHALDGGPPTSEMEKDVVRRLGAMFGFPKDSLGHLTSGGTVANMEALWVARESHPDKAVAFSEQAHYTHKRMGEVLRMKTVAIPAHPDGRIRLDVLEDALQSGKIGTVVMTAGSTGLGAVDPIEDILDWRGKYGIRIHVDAAYGGFYSLLAADSESPISEETRRHFRAIAGCDSVVVDPHKHGLQPYGCGCVIFRDPSVGRFYKHESSYTYFTSSELHLGEISLECSRAGAAAGALWLTLEMFPLEARGGLGPVLASGARAARRWYDLQTESDVLRPYVRPELDILTYFPIPDVKTAAAVDRLAQQVFESTMSDSDDPVFLSVLRVDNTHLAALHPEIDSEAGSTRILRSVLMKPEHLDAVDHLHARVESAVRLAQPAML
ncbi:MAG: aminotransferase class V-fold PLP-dependent enzyme [Rhodothermales bacterium]